MRENFTAGAFIKNKLAAAALSKNWQRCLKITKQKSIKQPAQRQSIICIYICIYISSNTLTNLLPKRENNKSNKGDIFAR
jgi:hypothetical protein